MPNFSAEFAEFGKNLCGFGIVCVYFYILQKSAEKFKFFLVIFMQKYFKNNIIFKSYKKYNSI